MLMIRQLLLTKYGGLWVDSSTILTAHPGDYLPEILEPNLFMNNAQAHLKREENIAIDMVSII